MGAYGQKRLESLEQIPLVPAKRGREEEEGLLDRPLWSHVAQRVTELLREGLGDRCVLARPLCGAAGEATEDFQGEGDVDDSHRRHS